MKSLFDDSGATFSDCGHYRYRLWRRWGTGPVVNFVCLNPSTADALVNDATVERLQRRATQWQFDGLVVTNLFAFRSTDPRQMLTAADPIGPANDAAILDAVQNAGLVVAAWGNHGCHRGRSQEVRTLLREAGVALHCLKVSGTGEPSHPLYLSYDLKPVPYEAP